MQNEHQQTVVLIKPDGVQRGLVGEILHRFERKGLKLVGLKMVHMTDELLEKWYAHHKDKPFFDNLKVFMKQTPVIASLWEGLDAVETVRKIAGVTKARAAEAGSVRGDLGMSIQLNLIHASDSPDTAQKERDLIFKPEEIFDYQSITETLIYSPDERK